MTTPLIRAATAADLPAVGLLTVELCRDPTAHCIHSWSGESGEENASELAAIHGRGELALVLAESSDGLLGAFGCEFDRELGRGWLFGLIARQDWDAVADQLKEALLAELPAGIADLTAFLHVANLRGRSFYLRHGFREDPRQHHEFRLDRDTPAPGDSLGTRLELDQRPSFFELFDDAFRNAYYSHDRLLEMQGDSHEIFVVSNGGRVDGFCVASHAASEERGEIQFVAVREEKRRQGIGKGLIASGIAWLRSVGVGEIILNVADDRTGARRLYEDTGFELQHSGVAFRFPGSGAAEETGV